MIDWKLLINSTSSKALSLLKSLTALNREEKQEENQGGMAPWVPISYVYWNGYLGVANADLNRGALLSGSFVEAGRDELELN